MPHLLQVHRRFKPEVPSAPALVFSPFSLCLRRLPFPSGSTCILTKLMPGKAHLQIPKSHSFGAALEVTVLSATHPLSIMQSEGIQVLLMPLQEFQVECGHWHYATWISLNILASNRSLHIMLRNDDVAPMPPCLRLLVAIINFYT